jgi:hypothetical protein
MTRFSLPSTLALLFNQLKEEDYAYEENGMSRRAADMGAVPARPGSNEYRMGG